jgi:hypothetical protein
MANITAILHLSVPPFVKGGQGGFHPAPVSQPLSNPPQPPFFKGRSSAGVQS